MSGMARRSFLKFLPAAVASAPVAAQEAAAKMGLTGLASAGGLERAIGHAGQPVSDAGYNHLKWLKDRLAQYADPEYIARLHKDARRHITRLDPDLASMRGISPSAAFSIQVEREVEKTIEAETWSLRRSIKEATGF